MNIDSQAHGAFVTRVSLGLVLIAHSLYLKLVVFTLPGTVQFFTSLGLPGAGAYVIFVVEAIAGVALVLGYRVQFAAAAVVPVLLGAAWAHWSNGWLFTNNGGGWEYPAFLAAVAVAQVFLGPGSYAIGASAQAAFLVDRAGRATS